MSRPVSISELKLFRRCPRQWWLKYHRGLRPREERKAGPRQRGTLVHGGLELHYDPFYRLAPDEVLGLLSWQLAVDLEEFPDQGAGIHKQHDLARIMLEGYFEWMEDSGEDADLEIVAAEETVEVESSVAGYSLRGKLDLRVTRERDGFIGFLDHKTTQDTEPTFRQSVRLEEQFPMYQLLLSRAHPGEVVHGGIYNALRTVKRTANATPPFYFRVEHPVSPTTMANFEVRLHATLERLAEVEGRLSAGEHHQLAVPPTPLARRCEWDCDFNYLCPMFDDGSRVEDAVAELYIERDPYDYYKAAGADEEDSE